MTEIRLFRQPLAFMYLYLETNAIDFEKVANETLEVLADIVLTLHSCGTHNARIVRNIERIVKGL